LSRVKQKTPGKDRQRGFFAESQPKNSRQRKKTLSTDFFAESQLGGSRQRISLSSANFFFALDKEIFKNHFFTSNFFQSSTYTYKKLMIKVGIISAMFAILKNFTS
jgi:hypothetical protein